MKKAQIPRLLALAMAAILAAGSFSTAVKAGDDHDGDQDRDSHHFEFKPNTLVLSRSVYEGDASTVTVGQVLPLGCVQNSTFLLNTIPSGTTTVKQTSCATAVSDGTYPTVWNNNGADGSFGVTSPIFLDNVTTDGKLLDTLRIPKDWIVTSFSSKSEVALNLGLDGKSITFVGYRGGPGCIITFNGLVGTLGAGNGPVSPTEPNLLDVSNSNTPGVCDPTNPVVSSNPMSPTVGTAYYRTVAEVDAHGHIWLTEGNAYSGNNGRAAIKANWLYYLTGNDNNGALSTKTDSGGNGLVNTQIGINLVTSTGAELLVPNQTPPIPPGINKIGDFEITQVGYTKADKAGKDNNFRGLTIHNNTMYMTKGSGGNGINTVYQVGTAGTLPSGSTAALAATPITILPGFPTSLASGVDQKGNAAPISFPFGIWFADDNTLYVADEGDDCTTHSSCSDVTTGTISTAFTHAASQTTAGLQKWIFDGKQWNRAYILQAGLNLGVQYVVPNYPAALNPAPDGLRNITGRVNHDGTVTIWAVTSTVSANGDQGADPNQLVAVTDVLKAKTLPTGDGDHDKDDTYEKFVTLRTAKYGEVLRGVSLAPKDRDGDDDHDRDH